MFLKKCFLPVYEVSRSRNSLLIVLIFLSTLGAMPRFSIAAAAANMAQYLSQNQGGQMKSNHGALVDRTHLYWPGLQGLVANPMAWRDRLGSSKLKQTQFFVPLLR